MNTGMDADDFYEQDDDAGSEESDDENENEFLESSSDDSETEESEEKKKEPESKPNGADKEKGKMGESAEISKPAQNPEPVLVEVPKPTEQAVAAPTPIPVIDNPPIEKALPNNEAAGPSSAPTTVASNPVPVGKEEISVDNNVNNNVEAGSSSNKGKKSKKPKSAKKKKCIIM